MAVRSDQNPDDEPAAPYGSRPPYERLLWLDREIRTGRFPSVEDLVEEFEVSARTAYRDVAFLRYNLDAPLEFDHARGGYRYSNETYSLPWVQLSEGEFAALFIAEKVLAQYAGTPFEPDLRSAFQKLSSAAPRNVSLDLAGFQAAVSFDAGPARPVELEAYTACLAAIEERERLKVRYYTVGRDEETERVLDPLHLHNMAGDWYLVAYDHLRKDVRDFALSRFRSINREGARFDPHVEFDLEDHLASQFGGYRGGDPVEIEVRFDAFQSRWMRERVWPGEFERSEACDGSLTLRLRVNNQDAATRWVSQYGPHAEAVAPEHWRREVAESLGAALSSYGEAPSEGEER